MRAGLCRRPRADLRPAPGGRRQAGPCVGAARLRALPGRCARSRLSPAAAAGPPGRTPAGLRHTGQHLAPEPSSPVATIQKYRTAASTGGAGLRAGELPIDDVRDLLATYGGITQRGRVPQASLRWIVQTLLHQSVPHTQELPFLGSAVQGLSFDFDDGRYLVTFSNLGRPGRDWGSISAGSTKGLPSICRRGSCAGCTFTGPTIPACSMSR